MTITVTKQTLLEGSRNLVVQVNITADATAEATAATLVDASDYVLGFTSTDLMLMKLVYSTHGVGLSFLWDATTDVNFLAIGTNVSGEFCWEDIGGLVNNAGTGKTGDINYTTSGLTAGDHVALTFYLKKK